RPGDVQDLGPVGLGALDQGLLGLVGDGNAAEQEEQDDDRGPRWPMRAHERGAPIPGGPAMLASANAGCTPASASRASRARTESRTRAWAWTRPRRGTGAPGWAAVSCWK